MKTVIAVLEEVRTEAVRRIVERARLELPDYRTREVTELRSAVEQAYDVWRNAILYADFDSHHAHSQQVIRQNVARNIRPEQIARTPWLVYEVALGLLDEAEVRVNRLERAAFVSRAHQVTIRIAMVNSREISDMMIKNNRTPQVSSALPTEAD